MSKRYAKDWIYCRCCDKRNVPYYKEIAICTTCIPKHWGKHAKGINSSRCKEFGKKKNVNR